MWFWKRGWIAVFTSVLIIWVSLIPLPFLGEVKFIPIDKLGHLFAFFILELLYLWSFDYKKLKLPVRFVTFFITFFIGGLIELLQHYLPINRVGDWYDFIFDIVGIIIAIALYPKLKNMIHKKFLLSFFLFVTIQTYGQSNLETSLEFQNNLTEEYGNAETSPLDPDDLKSFKELQFFPIDSKFIVEAKLIKVQDSPFFGMATTTDRLPEYRVWAKAIFSINEIEYQLTVYQNKGLIDNPEYSDYLFLPFLDKTNGETTYGGGRYIDLRVSESETIIIDFNKAYNPYCAYSHRYSCPIVPSENFIDLEVEAGVKKFK